MTATTDNSYFRTPALHQRLELLQHLAEFGQQLVLLSAPAGAGKSAMMAELRRQLDDSHKVFLLETGLQADCQELLQQIAAGFGLSLKPDLGQDQALLSLRDHLQALEQAMVIPVLMVDRAEELSLEALWVILELGRQDASTGGRLRSILSGRPETDQALHDVRREKLQQDILHKLDLPAFSQAESGEFLSHYLLHEGRGVNQNLLAEKLDELFASSGGNPGRLIQLAEDLLVESEGDDGDVYIHTAESGQTARLSGVKIKTLGFALLLLTLVVAWSVLQPEGDSSSELIPLELPRPEAQGRKIAAEEPGSSAPLETVHLPSDEIQSLSLTQSASQESLAEEKVETLAKTITPTSVEKLPLEPVVPAETDLIEVPDKPLKAPEVKPEPVEVKKVKPVATPEIKPADNTVKVTARTTVYRNQDWIMAQAADKYVLQMLGMHEEKAALKFLRQQKQQENFSFFVTRYKSRPWYVVAYGLYDDKAEALRAIKKLPRSLRAQKPWARTIGDIQSLIQAAKRN